MNIDDLRLVRLAPDHEIKPFDCDDPDLNEFLFNDSKDYQDKLLAVTYILESDAQTVAFFSLLNDRIAMEDFDSKSQFRKRIAGCLPMRKRHKSYPAMKIGRLAVSIEFQGAGIGGMILGYIKNLFVNNNRTGCKFITVDAYNTSLGFYSKNGFDFFTREDEKLDTRQMYFDLIKVIEA